MGIVLPKPILSKVVDRAGNKQTYAGCAAVNGFRTTMEDAHMLVAEPGADCAYFGIFDGHSNDKCSEYIAREMPAKLRKLKLPASAEDLEKVCVDLDTAFLANNPDGGSTGTFILVPHKATEITVCNVGDSRTLVTRNGKLVFESKDHKPNDPGERERILRCDGTVVNNRVDADLAVSRAFGDGAFKVAGTKDPRNQKVIAVPDVTKVPCQTGDVIILACDGVFEGNFSNEEVCAFVHGQMEKCWEDLAVIACRVCDEAIRRGSKDNISCMIVQLADGSDKVARFGKSSFVPGPPFPRNHEACRTSYARMALLAGLTPAAALKQRYDILKAYLQDKTLSSLPPVQRTAFEMCDEVDVETEKAFFGKGPAPGNEMAFFEELCNNR